LADAEPQDDQRADEREQETSLHGLPPLLPLLTVPTVEPTRSYAVVRGLLRRRRELRHRRCRPSG
jgi:hypothetical protein